MSLWMWGEVEGWRDTLYGSTFDCWGGGGDTQLGENNYPAAAAAAALVPVLVKYNISRASAPHTAPGADTCSKGFTRWHNVTLSHVMSHVMSRNVTHLYKYTLGHNIRMAMMACLDNRRFVPYCAKNANYCRLRHPC